MHEVLDRVTLASGEPMDVVLVVAPDERWREGILPLLGHKEPFFQWQLAGMLDGDLQGLQVRFYIGVVGEQVITNVLVAGGDGAGIVGHVYTLPAYRRQGASRVVMARQMADMPRAGMTVLTMGAILGHPYQMYAGFGFRGLLEGTGMMLWEATPGAARALVGRPLGAVRPVRWADWGMMNLLPLLPVAGDEELPRSPALGINGLGEVEGPFVEVHHRQSLEPIGPQPASPPPTWLVLAADGPADTALGWALVLPSDRWFHDAQTLDLFVRPGYGDLEEGYRRLLSALPGGARRIACASAADGPRAAALLAAGFQVACTLPDWLPGERGRRDVRLFVRV